MTATGLDSEYHFHWSVIAKLSLFAILGLLSEPATAFEAKDSSRR